MSRIKILTDSTSDLPQELIEKYGVTVLPMVVKFGEEEYLDGINITTSEFYQKMAQFDGFPTTSQINPAIFATAYKELSKETDVIISVILSSKLSGTFNSAQIAAQMVEDEVKVICYDSESAVLGLGFMVIEAAKAVEAGCTPEEVIQRLDQVKETLEIYFAVQSLDHLEKGGRIGKATAFLGGLLNIVPLLTVEEGAIGPKEKIRGKKRISKRLTELLQEGIDRFGGKEKIVVGIIHTDNLEGAKQLAQHFEATFGIDDPVISEVGPTVGTHIGPGVIAIVYYKKIS